MLPAVDQPARLPTEPLPNSGLVMWIGFALAIESDKASAMVMDGSMVFMFVLGCRPICWLSSRKAGVSFVAERYIAVNFA